MDFRAWLAANDTGAKQQGGSLSYVGNDGRIDPTKAGYGAVVVGGTSYGQSTTDKSAAQKAIDRAYAQYQAANAPAANSGGSVSSGGSTGGSSSNVSNNAAQIAQYDQGIGNLNSSLGRLDQDLYSGYLNADTGYNSNLNRLMQSKADNRQAYDKNVNATKQENVGAKNSINVNTGNSLNSIQRLLASKGAGGSSAATMAAPEAAARQGTLQRQGVNDTFAKNLQTAETGWNTYMRDAANEEKSYGDQRDNQKAQSLASVNQNRASLLQQLAQLVGNKTALQGGNATAASQGYLDQANNYLGEASRLGTLKPVAQVAPSVYNAPELSQYTVNPNAAPTINGQAPATTDYASPFLSLLLGRRDEQRQL